MEGKQPTMPLRACQDCLVLLANGETDPNWTEEETSEYLARVDRGIGDTEVTLGMLAEYHSCTEDGTIVDDCECENMGFSWSPCDVCGSNLGGDRYAVTFWVEG